MAAIVLLGLSACASPALRSVPRVVDGQVEQGAFVSPYAYEWFIEGEMSAAKGRHDEAALAFESAAAAPADDVLLMARLAEEYEFSGESRRADRTLAQAQRVYPRSPRIALAEGRIRRHRGHAMAALESFARAEDLAPSWDQPVVESAEMLIATGHRQRASALLLGRIETSPGTPSDYVLQVLLDLARQSGDAETLARTLSLDPSSTPNARAQEAGALALGTGRPALAARLLGEGLQTPENIKLWLRALIDSGEREAAAEFLRNVDSQRLGGPLEHADALLEVGEVAPALDLLKALEVSPRTELVKGRALLAQGDFVQAAAVLAEVPLGAASFEASRMALADCSLSVARPGAAAETLSQAPHASLPLREKLAQIYLEEGEVRAGLRLFDPKQDAERGALAALFERAGRFDEAAAYYATLRLPSTREPRLQARASAEQLAARGRLQDAVDVLEIWTNSAPDDLHARVRLVELRIAENEAEAAEKEGRVALGVIDDATLRAHLVAILSESESVSE